MTPKQEQALKEHLQAIAKILYDESDPATMQTLEGIEWKHPISGSKVRTR